MFKSVIYRPVWLPLAVTATLLMVALLLLLMTASRSVDRLVPVHEHLNELMLLQDVALHVDQLMVENPPGGGNTREVLLNELRIVLDRDYLVANTPITLRRIYNELNDADFATSRVLGDTLHGIHAVLTDETRAHDQLLAQVSRAASHSQRIAATTVVAIPLLAVFVLFMIRRRVLRPLDNLGGLMQSLASRDSSPVDTARVDPLIRPLFANYNALLERLAELEQEHAARRESLEEQVRNATGALLAQQRELANAERLAAVGELAARLAHELRNPLAGMRMAIGNLHDETQHAEQRQRLEMVASELDRITTLLNGLLDQARHEPEASVPVAMASLVNDLLTLARYQMPANLQIQAEVPEGLACLLPEGGLRQALLNLIINAQQALGADGGHIRVRVGYHPGSASLVVEDNGPGFSPAWLANGIRQFRSSRHEGTGLGLAMVRRFAEGLNGELRLENLTPHGARVTLQLPCSESHA